VEVAVRRIFRVVMSVVLLSGHLNASDYVMDAYKYIYGVKEMVGLGTDINDSLDDIKSGSDDNLSTALEAIWDKMSELNGSFKNAYTINSIIITDKIKYNLGNDSDKGGFAKYFSDLAKTGQGILIAHHIYDNIVCSSVVLEGNDKVVKNEELVEIFPIQTGGTFISYRAEFYGLLDCFSYACSPTATELRDLFYRPVKSNLLEKIRKELNDITNTEIGMTSTPGASAMNIEYKHEHAFTDFLTAVYCGAIAKKEGFDAIIRSAILALDNVDAVGERLIEVALRVLGDTTNKLMINGNNYGKIGQKGE
jgi:hypothetical protein